MSAPSPPEREPFLVRLEARMQRCASRVVVGLDPVLERMPAELACREPEEALVAFSEHVLEAVADQVVAVKPQVAFFERHGWRGVRALQRVLVAAARFDLPVILDAKRGDIGSTARAYAAACLGDDPETLGPWVDALTVNPYLGTDSVEPFLEHARRRGAGLFVLGRTSNPGGAEFQALPTPEIPLYLQVARSVAAWGEQVTAAGGEGAARHGYTPVGLVAGATFPEELRQLREAAPGAWLLLPGVGAQGGRHEDVLPAFDAAGRGGLVPISRGITYAYETSEAAGGDWQGAVAAAARQHREQLEGVLTRR